MKNKMLFLTFLFFSVNCLGANFVTENIKNALKPIGDESTKLESDWIYLTESSNTKVYLLKKNWALRYYQSKDLNDDFKTINGWLQTKALKEKTIDGKVFNNTMEHWNINCKNATYFIDAGTYFLDDDTVTTEEYLRPKTYEDYMGDGDFEFRYPMPESLADKIITTACGFEHSPEAKKKYLDKLFQ